ncbi:Nif11-like leader peptide family natural product precursor [Synechococcus sp. KORDI-52]|uniref:Nif11-like leader peptide family natural product precursor n=1 Tax=Synechococcus sp. KORDI-52 TaxID=585425 RepID=UPI0008FFD9DC|nr:Nif11-like leader peptide family natural product precursor [Synechococcus sp. KORDI-52]
MSLTAVIDFMRAVKITPLLGDQVKTARERASQRCQGGFDDEYLDQLVKLAEQAGYKISVKELRQVPGFLPVNDPN